METEGSELSYAESLRATIESNLTDTERRSAVVYLNNCLMPPGIFSLSGSQVNVAHPYLVVFLDCNPGANWMHPCRYLLIDPASRKITSLESDRPPVFGLLPSSWQIVIRPAGFEEWRAIPIATHQEESTEI